MKIGNLVRIKNSSNREWLGIIVREIAGSMKIKNVEWVHARADQARGSYAEKALELISETR